MCVCVVCCLAAQISKTNTSLSPSGIGDCKVARVGTPATDYKLVVRPWESGIRPCISCHFPNYCVCVCVKCVCVCVCVSVCMCVCVERRHCAGVFEESASRTTKYNALYDSRVTTHLCLIPSGDFSTSTVCTASVNVCMF